MGRQLGARAIRFDFAILLRSTALSLAVTGFALGASAQSSPEEAKPAQTVPAKPVPAQADPKPAAPKPAAAPPSSADKLAAAVLAKDAAPATPKSTTAKPAAKPAEKITAPATTTAATKPVTTPVATKPATIAAKPATTASATATSTAAPTAAATAAKPPVKTAAKKAKPKVKTIDDMAVEGQVSLTLAALTNWINTSKDNRKLPFAVVDKNTAQILVFDATGKLKGMAPILIGSAVGDTSAEGVGDRELKDIPMLDRTTPAGRFVAGYGPATGHSKVLWIDYPTAISIHPVLTTAAAKFEKRAQRLTSKTPDDNRITHGCINVSSTFYANTVRSVFGKKGGVFYVIPDSISLLEAFPAYVPPAPETAIASLEEPVVAPVEPVKTAEPKQAPKQPKEKTASLEKSAPQKTAPKTAKTVLE
jgi:hypothetical protein